MNLKIKMFLNSYRFLPFFKTVSKKIDKNICKNVSGEYNQKLLDHAKQSAIDPPETTLKRLVQKTTDVTGNLIGNKTADKITKNSW